MKLSAYKDLEASKRAQTLSRIILIAGAHLVIIGGAYLVTHFGSGQSDDSGSIAGVGTWSNQDSDANQPSVDASSNTLFDKRAGDLDGYNAGDGKPMRVASSNNAPSQSSGGRYAPRRPEGSSSSSTSPSQSSSRSTTSQADDGILQPLNNANSSLYPERPSTSSSQGLSQAFEYKVQSGDSLWEISQRFKVSVSEIAAANPGIKANAIRVGQTINVPRNSDSPRSSSLSSSSSTSPQSTPSNANGPKYTVKSGDSLSRIASRQGVTVAELKAANGLSGDMIRVGQELTIPSKTRSSELVSKQHRGPKVTVEAGDTLDKYAAIYGVSVRDLMRVNDITDPRMIRIGQTLLIPESGQAAPAMQQPSRTQPQSQPQQRTVEEPVQTLDQLAPEPSTLPTLDDEFGDEDIESQPLVPIED